MAGIISYGAYVPYYRLSLGEIARAWGRPPTPGERAVTNFDEDSLTMAVAAATDCLKGIDRQSVDGFLFASTTPPYKEKLCSSVAAMAADLRRNVWAADFGNSLRAGSNALRAALDAVKSGSAKKVLVAAADCRMGAPGSEFEQGFGDGAAAFIVGDSDVAVEVECIYTHSDEFMDQWRSDADSFIKTWEDRFILMHGYTDNVREAVRGLLAQNKLSPRDFTKVVLYGPNQRSLIEATLSLGFDHRTQLQDPFFSQLGNTGCAFSLMLLVAALENAKPGDRILLVSYGDGCNAFCLRVTDAIEKVRDRRGIKQHLASKAMLPSYEKFQQFRNLVSREAAPHPGIAVYLPMMWRDRSVVLSLHAGKCNRCGTISFPIQRVCINCQSKDDYQEVRLSDKRGKIFTFSKDFLAPSANPPTIRCVVEFEGGGRLLGVMTDCDPDKVEINLPVNMTFRKVVDSPNIGVHSYFWRCTPRF